LEANSVKNIWLKCTPYLPQALSILMVLLLMAGAYFVNQWSIADGYNKTYRNAVLLEDWQINNQSTLALQQALLLKQQKQTPENIKRMIHLLAIAESAEDVAVRTRAKYAVGNLYFDLSSISADVAAGGSHQKAVAQIALAREAYKSAIRLDAAMYDARFNLELLDRLSPEKRTQAWLAETDGVTLQPFKRNGSARMKDNRRRGLP